MSRLTRSIPFLLLSLAGCSPGTKECESTLTLTEDDRGAARGLDGCTSLIVSLRKEAGSGWASAPMIAKASVLRFDYMIEDAVHIEYYLTPLQPGSTEVQVASVPAGDSWNATIGVDIRR